MGIYNEIPAPTLSPAGWVTDIPTKADFIVSWFFETMKSQTYIYGSNLESIQYILQQNVNNVPKLCTEITTSLERLLGRYFDVVNVNVNSNADSDTSVVEVGININCIITHKGIQYSLGRLLEISNSTITNIFNTNNG